MGTTLRAAPSKSHAFSTNYHACIAIPTWCRCAPPILFWHWPPYNLLPRSCLTWIFFVDPHWWVPLCVQCPAKAMYMPFKQIIMHALQSQHDVDVHLLFCFDIDLHITCSQLHVSSLILTDGYHFVCSAQQSMCHFDILSCIYCNAHMIYMYTFFVLTSINSCFVHEQQHAPPRIAGAGHPCSDRSLFMYLVSSGFSCQRYVITSKSSSWRPKACHDVKKFVMTSKRHDVTNLSWRQIDVKTRHDVKTTSWRQNYLMT